MKKLQEILGWCLVINTIFLLVITMMIVLAYQEIYQIYVELFQLTWDTYNLIMIGFIGIWKVLIFVFIAIPYVAIRMVGNKNEAVPTNDSN